MDFKNKYRLELHWEKVEKSKDSIIYLNGGYFFGPALKIAKEINHSDSIVLDFTPQYSKILTSYYFATLSWGKVEYVNDKVLLNDLKLTGDFVNTVYSIKDTDYIVIDTELHEEEKHVFNLVYPSKILNREGEENC